MTEQLLIKPTTSGTNQSNAGYVESDYTYGVESPNALRKLCLFLSNAILQFPQIFELQQQILNQPTLLRKEVEDEIASLKAENVNVRVIDYGCGSGTYTGLFSPDNYLGIDCSLPMIKHAQKQHPQHKFLHADNLEGIKSNLEDVSAIFLVGVIHHLPENLLISILDCLPKTNKVRMLSIDTLKCNSGLGAIVQLFERGEFLRDERDHKRILDRIASQLSYKKVPYGSCFDLAVFRGIVRTDIA